MKQLKRPRLNCHQLLKLRSTFHSLPLTLLDPSTLTLNFSVRNSSLWLTPSFNALLTLARRLLRMPVSSHQKSMRSFSLAVCLVCRRLLRQLSLSSEGNLPRVLTLMRPLRLVLRSKVVSLLVMLRTFSCSMSPLFLSVLKLSVVL